MYAPDAAFLVPPPLPPFSFWPYLKEITGSRNVHTKLQSGDCLVPETMHVGR